MKPPDDVRRDFTRQWLRKGMKDLAFAQRLLGGGEDAVQLAESTRKAVLSRLPSDVRPR